jgi:hypothetical protein
MYVFRTYLSSCKVRDSYSRCIFEFHIRDSYSRFIFEIHIRDSYSRCIHTHSRKHEFICGSAICIHTFTQTYHHVWQGATSSKCTVRVCCLLSLHISMQHTYTYIYITYKRAYTYIDITYKRAYIHNHSPGWSLPCHICMHGRRGANPHV